MAGEHRPFDAVVIGGGFYGAAVASYLAQRGLGEVMLVEREGALLTRASFHNQARVHNGYHYPRSFTTAFRSRVNLPRFLERWSGAVRRDFTQLYAVARQNSKVTARQFERFCRHAGASLETAPPSVRRLFDERLIEDVYVVQEYAFDARVLAARVERDLADAGVRVLLNSRVTDVAPGPEGVYGVTLAGPRAGPCVLQARRVFNCTYAGLNQMGESFGTSKTALKQEITELALLQPPAALQPFGITVMDGPFFSFMPFPARNLHSLSHVRYTPHLQWADQPGRDPYAELSRHPRHTRVDRMMRDAGRYVPAILQSTYVESIFEVKTILEKNESDDGRPILFERHPTFRGCYSVLGGKIDNLFDVLEKLDAEPLDLAPAQQAPT